MTPAPTPQPDHGAAGFCTDHGLRVPDENGAGFWPALAGQNDRDAWTFMAERDAARAALDRVRAAINDAIPYLGERELAEPILRAALDPEEPR